MSTSVFADGSWAILELMGHRRLGGWVSEVEVFGSKMCRIDVPKMPIEVVELNGPVACLPTMTGPIAIHCTQFYSGGSVYCVTPCTQDTALDAAKLSQPAPVQAWEMPKSLPGMSPKCRNCGLPRMICDCEDDSGFDDDGGD